MALSTIAGSERDGALRAAGQRAGAHAAYCMHAVASQTSCTASRAVELSWASSTCTTAWLHTHPSCPARLHRPANFGSHRSPIHAHSYAYAPSPSRPPQSASSTPSGTTASALPARWGTPPRPCMTRSAARLSTAAATSPLLQRVRHVQLAGLGLHTPLFLRLGTKHLGMHPLLPPLHGRNPAQEWRQAEEERMRHAPFEANPTKFAFLNPFRSARAGRFDACMLASLASLLDDAPCISSTPINLAPTIAATTSRPAVLSTTNEGPTRGPCSPAAALFALLSVSCSCARCELSAAVTL